jgi:hypothetical protein
MDIQRNAPAASRPRMVGRFAGPQALLWMLAAPALGVAVARLAVWAQNFWAPLLIFPLLVGCGLGLWLVGVMRLGQVGHRATIWSGAVLAATVAAAGQHYMSFLDFKAALIAQKPQGFALEDFQGTMPDAATDFSRFMQRQAVLGRPVTAEYRLRGAAAWASWAIDGLLTLLAAGTVVYLACRAPYCSVCRSWYRTTRAGPLPADRARRLAEAAALSIEGPLGSAQYRLSHCVGGCGPGRLELAGAPMYSWVGGQQRTKVVEAWLSAAQRAEVARVLDAEIGPDGMNG